MVSASVSVSLCPVCGGVLEGVRCGRPCRPSPRRERRSAAAAGLGDTLVAQAGRRGGSARPRARHMHADAELFISEAPRASERIGKIVARKDRAR